MLEGASFFLKGSVYLPLTVVAIVKGQYQHRAVSCILFSQEQYFENWSISF